MSKTARRGAPDSATRHRLLEIAERLMAEEGYAAVTSRRIAQEAGVTSPLVHYYFPTMDDLFLELLAKVADENLSRQADALASPHPLRTLWKLASHPAGAAGTAEFASLAMHRPQIRAEIARHAERFRSQQIDIVRTLAVRGDLGIKPEDVAGFVVILTSLGRIVGQEHELGISLGHDSARDLLLSVVDAIEGVRSSTS